MNIISARNACSVWITCPARWHASIPQTETRRNWSTNSWIFISRWFAQCYTEADRARSLTVGKSLAVYRPRDVSSVNIPVRWERRSLPVNTSLINIGPNLSSDGSCFLSQLSVMTRTQSIYLPTQKAKQVDKPVLWADDTLHILDGTSKWWQTRGRRTVFYGRRLNRIGYKLYCGESWPRLLDLIQVSRSALSFNPWQTWTR